jgi:hypothetical protein
VSASFTIKAQVFLFGGSDQKDILPQQRGGNRGMLVMLARALEPSKALGIAMLAFMVLFINYIE